MNQAPRTLSYNPAENAVLLTSDVDGGSYELYKIPKDARGDNAPVGVMIFLSFYFSGCDGLSTVFCVLRTILKAPLVAGMGLSCMCQSGAWAGGSMCGHAVSQGTWKPR
jgi:hypothetical protein